MAYRIIKWVKGRPYLYEQNSYRVGGRVRTESRYLGAATPADVSAIRTRQQTRKAVAELSDADLIPPPPPPSFAPPKRRVITTKDNTPPLRITANLKAQRIGEKPLQHWYRYATAHLAKLGLDLSLIPPVTVKRGCFARFRRARFSSGYVVTVPRGKWANRTAVRTNFSKAVAASCIDTLQQQKPELYAVLSLHFDQSHRATTRAVIQYMRHTRDRWKWSLILTAKMWHKVPPIYADKKRRKSRFLTPETIGLYEWGERKDWRADAETVLATVIRDGFGTVQQRWETEYRKARAAEKATLSAWRKAGAAERLTALVGRSEAKRNWRRASARLRALQEQGFALQTIQRVFDFEA